MYFFSKATFSSKYSCSQKKYILYTTCIDTELQASIEDFTCSEESDNFGK